MKLALDFVIVRTAAHDRAQQNPIMPRDRRYYSVYIMGSLSGTLYIGSAGSCTGAYFNINFITLRDSPQSTM